MPFNRVLKKKVYYDHTSVIETQISQKFDVFSPDWINMAHHTKYEYISHGLFKYRIQGLYSHDPNVKICASLVDERIQEFKKSIIGIGQLEFD